MKNRNNIRKGLRQVQARVLAEARVLLHLLRAVSLLPVILAFFLSQPAASAFYFNADSSNNTSSLITSPLLSAAGNCSGAELKLSGVYAGARSIIWTRDEATVTVSAIPSPISTVAGGTEGEDDAQLDFPLGIAVDKEGNIYIADQYNHRVQKWAPGADKGVTVAGGNGQGTGAHQLNYPYGVVVDGDGNLYVTDANNQRVQKWAPGAKSGVTVAGGNGRGNAAHQFSFPYGICLDKAGNIYVADNYNHRIQKWVPGAKAGITVAGGKGPGNLANQLKYPGSVQVTKDGTIYVADASNDRIQAWKPGAMAGVTVAGGNGRGDAANQLYYPTDMGLDSKGNIYITDITNHRVQRWTPGADSGVTVAGGNGLGNAMNQFNYPYGIFVDGNNNIYVADQYNHRVQYFRMEEKNAQYSFTLKATRPGKYRAAVDYTNGSRFVTEAVIIHPSPVVEVITGAPALCGGASTVFTETTGGGNWFSSNPAVATVDAGGMVKGVTAGEATISYVISNEFGCKTSVAKVIQVLTQPQVAPIVRGSVYVGASTGGSANAGNTLSVCAGKDLALANLTKGGAWSSGDTAIASINQQGIVKGMRQGSVEIFYSVTQYGCEATAKAVIMVNPLPATPVINGYNRVVEKNRIQLGSAQSAGTWSAVNENIAVVDARGLVTGVKPGITGVQYQIEDTNGCKTMATTHITVQPPAPFVKDSVYYASNSAQVFSVAAQVRARETARLNYFVSANGTVNENGPVVKAVAGDYTLWVNQVENGVAGPRVPFKVRIIAAGNAAKTFPSAFNGNDNQAGLHIMVMGNPATAYFTLRVQGNDVQPVTLRVLDAYGRTIEQKSGLNANSNIQFGHQYGTGNYFAELVQGSQRKVVQLLKIGTGSGSNNAVTTHTAALN